MSGELSSAERNRLQEILKRLCHIILTENEDISVSDLKEYLDGITKDDVSLLTGVSERLQDTEISGCVRSTVQLCMLDYLSNYKDIKPGDVRRVNSPFDFDNSDGFESFIDLFKEKYEEKIKSKLAAELENACDEDIKTRLLDEIRTVTVPKVFGTVFNCVKRISEQYRYFEQFYTIRFQLSQSTLLEKTESFVRETAKEYVDTAIKRSVRELAQEAADDAAGKASQEAARAAREAAEKAATQASSRAVDLAGQAARSAENAKAEAEGAAKKAVEEAVNKKMIEVSTRVSETTVTVLGIFSAIVLTVVGSFIYSSSVIGNAGKVNYFKLVSITSLVGLVCFDLLILMFHYIFRIRGNATQVTKNWIVIVANVVLGLVMIGAGILYFVATDPHDPEKTASSPTESVTEMPTETSTQVDDISAISTESTIPSSNGNTE